MIPRSRRSSIKWVTEHAFNSEMLAVVIQQAEKNNMLLNEDKLELIYFEEDTPKLPYSLPLEETLETSSNIGDLGVIGDKNISWAAYKLKCPAECVPRFSELLGRQISTPLSSSSILIPTPILSTLVHCGLPTRNKVT